MTLISRFAFREMPILIGDLLATADTDSGNAPDISIAGHASVNQHLKAIEAPFHVHKLVQKINKLSDKFYVAVAGDSYHIKTLLRRLSCIATDQDLSFSKVAALLDTIDPPERALVQAIGLIAKKDLVTRHTSFECFDYKVTRRHSPFYGNISVAGSGSDAFVSLIETYAHTATNKPKDVTAAMELGYEIQSILSGLDISHGGNILSRWGGGFECVTFDIEQEIFTKQDCCTHIFMVANFDDDIVATEFIPSVVYQCYSNEILCQHIVECLPSNKCKLHISRNETLYAPPALFEGHINSQDIEQNIRNEDSRHLCCHVRVHGLREPLWHSQIFHNERGKPLFTFNTSRSGLLSYNLAAEIPEKITEALRLQRPFFT